MSGVTFQLLLAGAIKKVTRFFNDNQNSGTSFTVNLGTAAANRIIVITFTSTGALPTTVTLGGTAMNIQVTTTRVSIWTLAVPAGTSATLALSGGGFAGGVEFAVYAMYGASSGTAFATSIAGSLNVPANGVCFGCADSGNPATPITCSGLTIDYDHNLLAVRRSAAASKEFPTAQTPLTVGFASALVNCEASFGP